MNPLQTPLLIYGTSSAEDFPMYERHFHESYRAGPVIDRFGRRVIFTPDRAHHVCFANPRHRKSDDMSRPVWRPDRAQRIPWILVALTHPTAVLKENQEPGNQGYLIAMQVVEETVRREYYQVIVRPRGDGSEVKFLTAYTLDDYQWRNAMTMKSVRLDRAPNKKAGVKPPPPHGLT
jgi:hypothetical protein